MALGFHEGDDTVIVAQTACNAKPEGAIPMNNPCTRRLILALVNAAAALLAAGGALAETYSITEVMSGLVTPRGLAFGPDGGLYVAEAGSGGPGPSASWAMETPLHSAHQRSVPTAQRRPNARAQWLALGGDHSRPRCGRTARHCLRFHRTSIRTIQFRIRCSATQTTTWVPPAQQWYDRETPDKRTGVTPARCRRDGARARFQSSRRNCRQQSV